MKIRFAAIVGSLLVAAAPALAKTAHPRGSDATAATAASAPSAPSAPAKRRAAKKSPPAATAAASAPSPDVTGTAARRKGKAAKGAGAAAVPAAYTAIPEAERLAIQADLALTGDFDATETKDYEARTVAAIKAFQQRHGGKSTGILSADERAALAMAAKAPQQAAGWQVIDDAATGARFGLPTKLVPQTSTTRNGSRWTSPHGQIQVETFRLHEAALPALFDEERKTPRTRRVAYGELKPDFFVLSGMQGLKIFIMRVQASGGELRGITVLYDQATEGIMAPVALAMADTFNGFPDANATPPAGRRSVEYATAIVVSGRGDLLTVRQVTDDCRSIAIPRLGQAVRIATDKSTDLALIRIYGARNLTVAALAGGGNDSGNLTLVGVADPLAQAGRDAVTRTAAQMTGQGLAPVPKPGFSGAAAIDAQGRFAGVVKLNAPDVAGIVDSATPQATLIPADGVRAFLAAQKIAPGSGTAAMEQSIVRVICVRR